MLETFSPEFFEELVDWTKFPRSVTFQYNESVPSGFIGVKTCDIMACAVNQSLLTVGNYTNM